MISARRPKSSEPRGSFEASNHALQPLPGHALQPLPAERTNFGRKETLPARAWEEEDTREQPGLSQQRRRRQVEEEDAMAAAEGDDDYESVKRQMLAKLAERDSLTAELSEYAENVREREATGALSTSDADGDSMLMMRLLLEEEEEAERTTRRAKTKKTRIATDRSLLVTDEQIRLGLEAIDALDRKLKASQARARAVSEQLAMDAECASSYGGESPPSTASTDVQFFLTERRPNSKSSRFHKKKKKQPVVVDQKIKGDFIRENVENVARAGSLLTWEQEMRVAELEAEEQTDAFFDEADQKRIKELDAKLRLLRLEKEQEEEEEAVDPGGYGSYLEETREERLARARERSYDVKLAVQRHAPLIVLDDDEECGSAHRGAVRVADVRNLLDELARSGAASSELPADARAAVDALVSTMRPAIDTAAAMRDERRRMRTPQLDDLEPLVRPGITNEALEAATRRDRLDRRMTNMPTSNNEIGDLSEALFQASLKTNSALHHADAAIRRSQLELNTGDYYYSPSEATSSSSVDTTQPHEEKKDDAPAPSPTPTRSQVHDDDDEDDDARHFR